MMLLSIDPAIHGVGTALWEDGKLVAAEYVVNPSKDEGLKRWVGAAHAAYVWAHAVNNNKGYTYPNFRIDVLVCELAQLYSRGANKTKGDPNKCVLPLVAVDAALCALFSNAQVYSYQPHEWKHGTSKPEQKDIGKVEYVITTRVKERLTPEELVAIRWPNAAVNATKEDHKRSFDIVDAIGVGMHYLGRFERKRVYARE